MAVSGSLDVGDWFQATRIDDDITLLREPKVEALIRCNIWHVRGRDSDLLIDTGLGIASLRQAAQHLFAKPIVAFATHTHFDHTGGIHEFTTRVVHRLEAESMATGGDGMVLRRAGFGAEQVAAMRVAGYSLANDTLITAPPDAFDIDAHILQPAPATRLVEDGDVVDLGDRSFEVLHLPGHSPGSAGLWEAATGTLFSGDAIYDGPLLDNIEGADVTAYAVTMKRLRDLPVTVVHGGHDASFGRDRMREIATFYLRKWDA